MRATTFLIISSLHTTLVTPVLLLMDRKWRASPSVCARFSPFSLPPSNEPVPIYVSYATECCTECGPWSRWGNNAHSRVRLSIATRSFHESFTAPRSFSPPPPSLSLLVSFLFLSRNPSRTYRFTRSVYVSIRDPAVSVFRDKSDSSPRHT